MGKVLNMTYASSLTNLCEVNSSFDTGVLRIAYPGVNRNKSSISKEVFERCIKTMYNCPVVCNYDRETDTFGGHDMEIVRNADGDLRLINVTTPIGIVCESSRYWWDVVQEDDGTEREYLFTDVLLWKRQEGYQKIKRDGVSAHSMEINVKDGEIIDGIYHVYDFEFTAFAVIGKTPCFESSSLEVFSSQNFKQQLSEMMQDLKECFSLVNTSNEVDNISKKILAEGGKDLEEKNQLIAEYGIDISALDFSIDDFTVDELREKFEAIKATRVTEGTEPDNSRFALVSNLVDEIIRTLDETKIQREWGESARYMFVDCDFETNEVYCWDANDWLLYGFKYAIDGDKVTIDYDSKKRKKYVIADFDDGEQPSPFKSVFIQMEQKIQEGVELGNKYATVCDTVASMESELNELRKFKADAEDAVAAEERKQLLDKFNDLVGIEAFETLCQNCMAYSLEDLEEKCYAIRGRNNIGLKFSLEEKNPKFKVVKPDEANDTDEPYGGLFVKYKTKKN